MTNLTHIPAAPKAISFAELPAEMRRRKARLNVSHETLDAVSGLAHGYTAKLLAPTPIKGIGAISLPLMLRTLCFRLIVVGDDKALAKLFRQHKRRVSARSPVDFFCVEVRDHSELRSAFLRRYHQLIEPPDRLTEFLSADVAKILPPGHTLGRHSIQKLLEVLCVRLLPIDDFQALSEMSHRLVPRRTKRTDRRHWRYAKAKVS